MYSSDADRALWLCKKLETEESLMTDWERTFIDSIQHQAERDGWIPSPRQLETLERIDEQLLTRSPRR